MIFHLVLVCPHLAGNIVRPLPDLAPDMELAAHPTLIPTKPSKPYSCAGPGLCSVLLHQLNKSAISGLRAVVAGAAQVNATHI